MYKNKVIKEWTTEHIRDWVKKAMVLMKEVWDERIGERIFKGVFIITSEYIALDETKVSKLRIKAGEKAIRYEQKVDKLDQQRLVKKCLKERLEEGRETYSRLRTMRNGLNQ